jgi:hypothetical protein
VTRRPDDLITSEGVDEGSADSTAEAPRPEGDVLGPPPHGRPTREQDPAGPEDLESPDIRAAEQWQTGQQLAEGEG